MSPLVPSRRKFRRNVAPLQRTITGWRRIQRSGGRQRLSRLDRVIALPSSLLVSDLPARDKAGDAIRGASMLTVHHLNNSRSQRVLWLLEELELPYQIKHYQRDR